MRSTKSFSLETFETRLTPSAIFHYTDVDGDLVTVRSSKGTNSELASVMVAQHFGLGSILWEIDLSKKPSIFERTNLSVSAKRGTAGGDGSVNIGFINAGTTHGGTKIDLGSVSIAGDLGRIDVGDGVSDTPALTRLSVRSLGVFGTSTGAPSLASTIDGHVNRVSVTGDMQSSSIEVIDSGGANGKLGSITIGGSLIAGDSQKSGGIYSQNDMGPVVIGGDIRGGSPYLSMTGSVRSGGSMASVQVGGSLYGGSGIFSSEGIGSVRIRGSVFGESYGGVTSGGDIGFVQIGGDLRGGNSTQSGVIQAGGKLAGARIGGSIIGNVGLISGSISSSGNMGPVHVRGDVDGGDGNASGLIACYGNRASKITIDGSLIGGRGSESGLLYFSGTIDQLNIRQDIRGGDADGITLRTSGAVEAKHIENLRVGGSIISGVSSNRGILSESGSISATDDIKSITVMGKMVGNSENPVVIAARGQDHPRGTTDIAIGKLSVGGNVEFAKILAGFDPNGIGLNADAQIGTVNIGGSWIGSILNAGIDAHSGGFGNGDETKLAGDYGLGSVQDDPSVFSRIDQVNIGGTVLGPSGNVIGFGAEHLGRFRVNRTTISLTPGAHTDIFAGHDAVPIGVSTSPSTFDGFAVHVFEI